MTMKILKSFKIENAPSKITRLVVILSFLSTTDHIFYLSLRFIVGFSLISLQTNLLKYCSSNPQNGFQIDAD